MCHFVEFENAFTSISNSKDFLLGPMFDACDLNNDGVISYSEFVTYAVRRERELRVVFDELDSNDDGIIDKIDIKIGLKKLGLRASDDKINVLIKKMDFTNDGVITFADFQHFLSELGYKYFDETQNPAYQFFLD